MPIITNDQNERVEVSAPQGDMEFTHAMYPKTIKFISGYSAGVAAFLLERCEFLSNEERRHILMLSEVTDFVGAEQAFPMSQDSVTSDDLQAAHEIEMLDRAEAAYEFACEQRREDW